jgi:hypothetical protein
MNIAIYVPSWPPGFAPNGIVTYASYLVPALRQLGHQVFVLTHRKTVEDSDPYTIDLQRFAPSATLWQRAASWLAPESTQFQLVTSNIIRALRDLLTKYNIDVLEMEESFGWSFAISRLNMLPVLVRLHGPWFLNGRFDDSNCGRAANTHRQQAEGRGIEYADFVTAPAAEVLATVREHYGLKFLSNRIGTRVGNLGTPRVQSKLHPICWPL